MLFQLKTKDQKNKEVQQNFSKIDKLKSMFDKVKFVAKNVIYVKKWSENTLQTKILGSYPSTKNNDGRHLNIKQGSFLIKIIKDSDELMEKVKKLRQKSFFTKSTDKEFDTDEFDKYCDHLVVIDRSVSDDFVVGTYRLLLKPKFLKNQKFYSQSEFDISSLINYKQSTLLEAGRSCVHEKYRDGRIIKLLWRGLATYIVNNQVELIFGCASFPSGNYKLFSKQLSYLHHYHITPEKFKTFPHKNLKAKFRLVDKRLIHSEDEFRKLPPLIKAYLRVGAWVGSGAIVDNKFNTTDVLIILDSKKILKKYTQLSFNKIH